MVRLQKVVLAVYIIQGTPRLYIFPDRSPCSNVMNPNTPSIPVTLGRLPQRLAGINFSDPAVAHPSIIFCDSAMLISELHHVLGGNMDSSGYSVCEALSPKHGQTPFLFGTTWIESQIIDHHKNVSDAKHGPNLEAWSRGVEGRSLVNQYDDNRACSYLFQTFTVEEVRL
jgi:hypothetical protein